MTSIDSMARLSGVLSNVAESTDVLNLTDLSQSLRNEELKDLDMALHGGEAVVTNDRREKRAHFSPSSATKRASSVPAHASTNTRAADFPITSSTLTNNIPLRVKKQATTLRLPSFRLLGIAAPHSDLERSSQQTTENISRSPHDKQNDDALGPVCSCDRNPQFQPLLRQHSAPLLTPPEEDIAASLSVLPVIGTDPTATTDSNAGMEALKDTSTLNERAGASAVDSESIEATTAAGGFLAGGSRSSELEPSASPDTNEQTTGTGASRAWLAQAVDAAVSAPVSNKTGSAVKVLYHALPCPVSGQDSPEPINSFPTLIDILQGKLQTSTTPYIMATHAVPPRFNLANLPTSPPVTPSGARTETSSANIDYFNLAVFANAVPVNDYQAPGTSSTAPQSPCPVVPPASVDFTLLERYIPPSTSQEYLDLFNPTGPSVLLDRLFELSPDGGTLVFIYPTKVGAETFASQYLGPILDPILRSMVIIHQLSASLGIGVGRMDAINHMVNFEAMKRKISLLLKKLNRGTSSTKKSNYSLVFSSKESIPLERKVWTEWWTHQETPRVREVVARYFQRAERLPKNQDVTGSVLVREILSGVSTRQYDTGEEPKDDVEIGVFVVKRTA